MDRQIILDRRRDMNKTLCDELSVQDGLPQCRLARDVGDYTCRYSFRVPDGEEGDRYMCRYVLRVLEAFSGDIIGKEDHIPLAQTKEEEQYGF